MTKQYIKGYTRAQMVQYFFNHHTEGEYASPYISNYIYHTFDFRESKTLQQVFNEVCSTLSLFHEGTLKNRNMKRSGIKNHYLYSHIDNDNATTPTVKYVMGNDRKEKMHKLTKTQQNFKPLYTEKDFNKEETKPMQTSLHFDDDFENAEIEFIKELNPAPLVEDIKNADYINQSLQDPLQYLMEQIEKMNLPNLNQITLRQTINNREITITIS